MTTRQFARSLSLAALVGLGGCSVAYDGDLGPVATAPSGGILAITAAGVPGLPAGTRFSEAAIESAMPGFDAQSITMATETQTRSAFAVFKDGLQVLQVLPGGNGQIGAVHGVSARIQGPNGERIGMTLREAGVTRSDCREGTGLWSGMPICRARGGSGVTLVFAIPGYTDPNGLPDDATLATATLQRIIWSATGGAA